MSADSSPATPVKNLLMTSEVIVVVGSGGVGKTTMGAALATRAATEYDRNVLVVTVDPARRLADALGVGSVRQEPVPVDVGGGPGSLSAYAVDMSLSWDDLVARVAPNDFTRDALLANGLYQTLTRRFVKSHDYIALDNLLNLKETGDYDLIVVDTPPSLHALEILDAPQRMVEFFGSRLLRWITAPYRSRLLMLTAKPFIAIAERVLGGKFFAEIVEFFWLFSTLQPGFETRARGVEEQMLSSDTSYVVVTTSESMPQKVTKGLIAALDDRGLSLELLVVNRSLSGLIDEGSEPGLAIVDDQPLEFAIRRLLKEISSERNFLSSIAKGVPVIRVSWMPNSDRLVADLAFELEV